MKKIFSQTVGVIGTMILFLVSSIVPAIADAGTGFGAGHGVTLFGMFAVGLVVNAANLNALYISYKTIFNKAFQATEPQYTKIAMVVPSTTQVEVHEWLGAFPAMSEWIKERKISNLKGFKWQIENKDWESTVAVPRNSIEDDTHGLFSTIFQSMGGAAKNHPDDLVFKLLNDGFTGKGYDGKTFFATDHQGGSNKGTGVLNTANYGIAIAAIGRMKDDQGNPIFDGTEKLTLVTGPELESTAKTILNAEYISVANGSAQNNIWKGSADYLKSPKITSATAWFITVEKNGIRPVIFQERKKPEFLGLTNPTDKNVFMEKEFLFGADSRDNAGYGLYHFAYGSTGAV